MPVHPSRNRASNHKLMLVSMLWLATCLSACKDVKPTVFPGYAEAEYVRLASPVSGSLARIQVKKGAQVAADAPAFVLEQENERAARNEVHARVERAAAVLANLQSGKRPQEIAALQAQLSQAEASLALSTADLQRQSQLVTAKFVAPARADEARTAVARDQAKIREVRAQIEAGKLPARPQEILAAEQDLQAAQAQLSQANWRLDQKTQRIPAAGQVVDVLYREGEFVAAGSPVISLLPPQNIKARFFVPEAVLGSLRIGQALSLQCDGCAAPIAATLSFIATEAEYTAPLIYSKENRANLVFMIEARPAPADAMKLHPGQPLEVSFAGAGK